ncbi:MAG: serine hydrolase [Pseudomonadota bacterium]
MFTRRQTLASGAGAALLGGCAASVPRDGDAMEPEYRTVPGQARLLVGADGTRTAEVSGRHEGRPFTPDSPFRVASVSKVLVGELARRLHADGQLDLDADAADLLDVPLRHPDHPDAPVTLRRLVSHRSGIIDPAVYWMAAPGDIRDLLIDTIWEPGVRPGAGFRYANLNYGLAATVMEAATGERFDRLFTRHVADPLGLDIGFNWSGVSPAKRRSGFPALRGIPAAWAVQVDGADTLAGAQPAILREDGWDLRDYVPGTNGTLFSPQGGLRASVNDLAVIGQEVILAQPELWTQLWIAAQTGGRGSESEVVAGRGSEEGHFVAFGDALYIYPDGPLPGETDAAWVGHHGEAYGVYCGLWAVPARGEVFVHADLGSPPDGSPLLGGTPNQTALATEAFAWASRRIAG